MFKKEKVKLRNFSQKVCVLLVCTTLLATLFGCNSQTDSSGIDKYPEYGDYKDIPGVTGQEIELIEELKSSREKFVYGMCPSTESFYDESGSAGGYTVFFCEWLTDLFGIEFEPVILEWDALHSQMESGKIDFTGEMTPSPERLEKYSMTTPIAERNLKTVMLRDAEDLAKTAEERTPVFAFLEGANTEALVKSAAEYSFDSVYITNYEDVAAKLRNNEIDAFLIDGPAEEAFNTYADLVSEDFTPTIYNPISLAALDPRLEPIISVMQKYLDNGAAFQLIKLYNEGQQEYFRHKLFLMLTDEEKEYIANHVENSIPIPVAMEMDVYPIIFFNRQENEWQGIANDTLSEIARLTDLTFEAANEPDVSWHTILDMLEDGDVAMTTELIYSKQRDGRFLWADEPYTEDYYALLSTIEHEDINVNQILYSKVGLVLDSAYADVFSTWFPEHQGTEIFMNMDEAFSALEKGEIDLLMASKNLLLRVTNYMELPGFKANFVFDRGYGSTFGFNKDETTLRSIVSKAQSVIDTERITGRWTGKVFDYRAAVTRRQIPIFIGLSVVAAIAFILTFMLAALRHRSNVLLENTVYKRTAELQVQTDAATVAAKAKGEFLARMSHEIRTPLNAIIGMNNIALNSNDLQKSHECHEKIDNASRHLLGVINDILDMSKIDADKFDLSYSEFDFEKVMMSIINVTNFRVEEKHQDLIINLGRDVPAIIFGDELRLSQVITNLLSNAVKFTPDRGCVVLTVSKTAESGNDVILQIEVADNGIGISAEHQARLFSSFEQADGSISRKFGGTGLGLAISKRIVELMGGSIWIESELGKGSKFTFTVKVQKVEDKNHSKISPKIDKNNLRILAVDDSEETLRCFSEVMAAHNLPCDVAIRGEDALSMIRESGSKPYNIFFIDWQMPEMDGIELTKKIKEITSDNSVVFMISVAAWSGIEAEALLAGVKSFIPKPLFPSSLVNAINECLGVESAKTEVRAQTRSSIPDFGKHTILIAEDIEINREIMVAVLEDTHISVDFAENGREAVSAYQNNPGKYSLILMDIQMPEMNGYEATRQIRSLESEFNTEKNIPIIAMTANVFKEDIENCLAAGMNNHIGKPIDSSALFETLKAYLA